MFVDYLLAINLLAVLCCRLVPQRLALHALDHAGGAVVAHALRRCSMEIEACWVSVTIAWRIIHLVLFLFDLLRRHPRLHGEDRSS